VSFLQNRISFQPKRSQGTPGIITPTIGIMLTNISIRHPFIHLNPIYAKVDGPRPLPDPSTLPPLPLETPLETVFLGTYPPLPSPTPEEDTTLKQISSQPAHCDQNDQDLFLPHSTPYSSYTSNIRHAILKENYVYIASYHERPYAEVQTALSVHLHLRSLLRSNLTLLRTHGEAGILDALHGLAINAFAQNHCAIAETLVSFQGNAYTYGLPDYAEYRVSRNYFSHSFLTMSRTREDVEREVKGKTKLYNVLYRQIVITVEMLEVQLKDRDSWEEPERRVMQCEEELMGEDGGMVGDWSNSEHWDEDSRDDPVEWNDGSDTALDEEFRQPDQPKYGILLRSFMALYFHSSLVRSAATAVQDLLWRLNEDYAIACSTDVSTAEQDFDEDCWLSKESPVDEGHESGKEI
jgi:hypothetical protein